MCRFSNIQGSFVNDFNNTAKFSAFQKIKVVFMVHNFKNTGKFGLYSILLLIYMCARGRNATAISLGNVFVQVMEIYHNFNLLFCSHSKSS